MKADWARQFAEVLTRAIGASPSERAALLEGGCDASMRAELERLLRAYDATHEAVTVEPTTLPPGARPPPARPAGTGAAEGEGAGRRIGCYRLLHLLGEGGFGSVYLAEQERPVARRVALKVIKLGMDTRAVIARFEAERQALAMMDHANIARVFDAGTTESGRPYFVMELVKGEPITEYCDRHSLSIADRLTLFLQVCQAVQHAHTKGIIHRDIKPSNILVSTQDDRPFAKVIDFGIAKATSARLTERTLFTEQRQLIGTPEYMSPEQAEGSLDLDTRTDVYSLGVLLYELLTGRRPFDARDLRSAAYGEIQRIIREVEPPRPSTRLSQAGAALAEIASRRRTEPRRLGALVRGELDWIVMKAMEKDRARRYETADGLAQDIARHLQGDPVQAAPPSAAYRLRKMVQRHRGAAAAACTACLALVLALVGVYAGLVRARAGERIAVDARAVEGQARAAAQASEAKARREAEAARTQAAIAQATDRFLREMFESIDPDRARGREVTVREVLDDAAARVEGAFPDAPLVEASLRQTFGETYAHLARLPEARAQLERARELRRGVLGAEHPETLTSEHHVGAVLLEMGAADAAAEVLRGVLEARARVLGSEAGDTLATRSLLAYARQLGGDAEGALGEYRQTLAAQQRTLGPDAADTLETMASVADALEDLGRLDEARETAEQLVRLAEGAHGVDARVTLMGRSILASILDDLGRYEESERLSREVLAAKTRVFGESHPETMTTANVLALTLERLERHDEAAAILRRISDAAAASLGPDHATTLTYLANLGRAEQLRGNLDEAEGLLRRVLASRSATLGADHLDTLIVMNNLGLLLLERGNAAAAEAVFRGMLSGIEKALPADHWMLGQARVNVAQALLDLGRYAEAEPLMLEGYERMTAALPAGHARLGRAAEAIATLYREWGKPELEAQWRAKAAAGGGG